MRHDATVTRCTVQRAASPGHGVTVRAASRGSEVAGRSGRPTGSATVLHISHTKQENRRAKQTLCVSTLQGGVEEEKWVSDYVYTLQLVGEGSRATMVKRGHSRASVGRVRQDGQVRSRSHYSRPAGLPACPVSWLPLKHVRRWSKSREWVGNLYTAASPSAAVGQARSGQREITSFLL